MAISSQASPEWTGCSLDNARHDSWDVRRRRPCRSTCCEQYEQGDY